MTNVVPLRKKNVVPLFDIPATGCNSHTHRISFHGNHGVESFNFSVTGKCDYLCRERLDAAGKKLRDG